MSSDFKSVLEVRTEVIDLLVWCGMLHAKLWIVFMRFGLFFFSLFRTWSSREVDKSSFHRLLPPHLLSMPMNSVRESSLMKKQRQHPPLHIHVVIFPSFFSFNRQFSSYAGRLQEDRYIYRYGPQLQSADAVNQWTGIVCSSDVL